MYGRILINFWLCFIEHLIFFNWTGIWMEMINADIQHKPVIYLPGFTNRSILLSLIEANSWTATAR